MEQMCFQRLRQEPRGEIGVLSAHNWTKLWTTFHNQLGSRCLIVEEPQAR
jgi:hypothetical protein